MIAMTGCTTVGGGRGHEALLRGGRAEVARTSYVECPVCAYEPPEQLLPPRTPCPKCHASCWKRSVRGAPDADA
jgi:hypothetical protein